MAMDWQALLQRLVPVPMPAESEQVSYVHLAQAAHREMEAAYSQFMEVRDPDLVDHAIYRLRAAERHYIFLLRQVRDAQSASSGEEGSIDSTGG